MTTDLNALGLARAGIPIHGYGDLEAVENYDERVRLYQRLKVRLDIFTESIVMTQYGDSQQPTSCYEVAPDALAAAFAGLPISTGLLPENCLFYTRAGEEQIGLYLPPALRKLNLHLAAQRLADGISEIEIPLPGLVFAGSGRTYSVFALPARPTSGRDPLYNAPLPNVYESGVICAGNVQMPACAPGRIHEAARLFLESYFNDHLVGRRSQKHGSNVLDLWRELADAGATEYPVDDLVKTDKILEDLWTR